MKDRKTISNEPHEIQTVIDAMKKEGITLKRSQVEAAREAVGNDREAVYNYLRENHDTI